MGAAAEKGKKGVSGGGSWTSDGSCRGRFDGSCRGRFDGRSPHDADHHDGNCRVAGRDRTFLHRSWTSHDWKPTSRHKKQIALCKKQIFLCKKQASLCKKRSSHHKKQTDGRLGGCSPHAVVLPDENSPHEPARLGGCGLRAVHDPPLRSLLRCAAVEAIQNIGPSAWRSSRSMAGRWSRWYQKKNMRWASFSEGVLAEKTGSRV